MSESDFARHVDDLGYSDGHTMNPDKKLAVYQDALVHALRTNAKYARNEYMSHILWGIVILILGVTPPYTHVWVNVVFIFLSGLEFSFAVIDHRTHKHYLHRADLIEKDRS